MMGILIFGAVTFLLGFCLAYAGRLRGSQTSQAEDNTPIIEQLSVTPLASENGAAPMNGERLKALIKTLDDVAQFKGNSANFSMNALDLIVVYDETANRMRIMAPIAKVEGVPQNVLMRMLQANYNTALDVRYGVADGHIWSLFLHPLSSLTEDDFTSAAAQTAAAADNFGHSYSSGRMMFRGGDHE